MHGERITCEGREEKIREEMKGAKFRREIKVKGETWKVQMVLRGGKIKCVREKITCGGEKSRITRRNKKAHKPRRKIKD